MKIKIHSASVSPSNPLVSGYIHWTVTTEINAYSPEEFARTINSAHCGFSVASTNNRWEIHTDNNKQLYKASDGSLRELVGDTLYDYIDSQQIDGRILNGFDGDHSLNEVVGDVLGGRFTIDDNSGRKYFKKTKIHRVLRIDEYILFELIENNIEMQCDTWFELSPEFEFEHAKFQIRAGVMSAPGFNQINPFTNSMKSAIFRRTNQQIELVCDDIIVLRTIADSATVTIRNNVDEDLLIQGNKVSQSVDESVDGCLSFSFIAQSGQYEIIRDGRFRVETDSNEYLIVNGTTTGFQVQTARKYIVDLERIADDVLVYLNRDGGLTMTGTFTGTTQIDDIFRVGDITFGSIVSCVAANRTESLQYVHNAYKRSTDATGYTRWDNLLMSTDDSSVYTEFKPTASIEILQYLGVKQIETGDAGPVVSDRYGDTVVDVPSAKRRYMRPGDEAVVPVDYTYRVMSYDRVLGAYRRVNGSALIDSI